MNGAMIIIVAVSPHSLFVIDELQPGLAIQMTLKTRRKLSIVWARMQLPTDRKSFGHHFKRLEVKLNLQDRESNAIKADYS